MSMALKTEKVTPEKRSRDSLPPMLQQYLDFKDAHPDCLILIQVGDFYECFFEDAVTLARTLNVTLTSRDKNSENPTPMAGVPIAVVDGYVTRLVASGFSVAIVSQVSAPTGKGMVQRALERIVTPGIQVHGQSADTSDSSFVAALAFGKHAAAGWESAFEIAIAFADVATGKIFLRQVSGIHQCEAELRKIAPKEIILPAQVDSQNIDRRLQWVRHFESALAVPMKFRNTEWVQALQERRSYGEMQGFGSLSPVGKKAVRLLVAFADETTVEGVLAFQEIATDFARDVVGIDATTRQNLEIVRNSKDGSAEGTLCGAIDRTKSVGGAKLLRRWLGNPSCCSETIRSRLAVTTAFINASIEREELQKSLRYMVDFDRIVARLELEVISPLELGALRDALACLPALTDRLNSIPSEAPLLAALIQSVQPCEELERALSESLAESPPMQLKEGGIFAAGFDGELDRLRSLKDSGSSWILKLEAEEREKSGISSLKIKHNNVHGYFIEITKANVAKAPERYTRKQTTTTGERFITPELKDIERQITGAQDKLLIRERELFVQLRAEVRQFSPYLRSLGEAIAMLDVFLSFAEVSESFGFVCPEVNESETLHIEQGKHPVLMQMLRGRFVPNSLHFSDGKRCAILTGANMGGKSTYLRQAALIVILAQVGCYVPAKRAVIGIVDRIFARLGASDDILEGESTFMVEMREAAHILSEATSRSLLLIDEIGRGTATADGLAIARSILEWIVSELRSRTLFATHFHELTALGEIDDSIFNVSIASVDDGEHVIFTHEIIAGPANRSYGLEVARIAGLPESLIVRARVLLNEFESSGRKEQGTAQLSMFSPVPQSPDIPREELKKISAARNLMESIENIAIEELTPLDALLVLAKMKDRLKSEG